MTNAPLRVYRDPLDDFPLDVQPLEPLSQEDLELHRPHWSEQFRYDIYDWEDPEFKAKNKGKTSWVPVPLTQGYFMMVARSELRLATEYPDGSLKRWYVDIRRDEEGNIIGVYAKRSGRRALGEPPRVYAHRELKGCLHISGVVDHKNGMGLDNRSTMNLVRTNHGANASNSINRRSRHFDLPPGVEIRGYGKDGQPRYGGIRSRRIKRKGKGSVLTIRTKRVWKTVGPPAKWYQNQLKRLHKGRQSWAHNPTSVNWPVFPPLLEREISREDYLMLQKTAEDSVHEEIPF